MLEGVIGLLAGLIVGVSIAAIVMKNRDGSDESVVSIKRENEAFRDEVNEHFVQTAELINQLTDSYKAVFDHLSDGAEKLVDPEVVRERMPQVGQEEVRLKRIGTVKPSDTDEDGEVPGPSEAAEAKDEQATQAAHQESSTSEAPEAESEAESEKDPADDAAKAEAVDPSEESTNRQDADEASHDEAAGSSGESLSDDGKDDRRER